MSESPHGIKIGDRVRLRSGGPLMVVAGGSKQDLHGSVEGACFCRWFDEDGHLQGEDFPLATLQVIEGAAK